MLYLTVCASCIWEAAANINTTPLPDFGISDSDHALQQRMEDKEDGGSGIDDEKGFTDALINMYEVEKLILSDPRVKVKP